MGDNARPHFSPVASFKLAMDTDTRMTREELDRQIAEIAPQISAHPMGEQWQYARPVLGEDFLFTVCLCLHGTAMYVGITTNDEWSATRQRLMDAGQNLIDIVRAQYQRLGGDWTPEGGPVFSFSPLF